MESLYLGVIINVDDKQNLFLSKTTHGKLTMIL